MIPERAASQSVFIAFLLTELYFLLLYKKMKNLVEKSLLWLSVTEGKDPGEWREVVTHRKDLVTGSESHIALALRNRSREVVSGYKPSHLAPVTFCCSQVL